MLFFFLGWSCTGEELPSCIPQQEIPYDGIDQDCRDGDLDDQDGDGWSIEEDCNDEDASIHPGMADPPVAGVDANCDGKNDYDEDGDGYIKGIDCDDFDASVNSEDHDRDGWSGCEGDCNDLDSHIYPGADRVCGDGQDNDCDGWDDCSLWGEVSADEMATATIVGDAENRGIGSILESGDGNGDGWPDLLTMDLDRVHVYLFNGPLNGEWSAENAQTVGINEYYEGALGDLNGDGYDDLALSNCSLFSERLAWIFYGPQPEVLDENKAEAILKVWPSSPSSCLTLTMGDVDGDGLKDLALGNDLLSPKGEVALLRGPLWGDVGEEQVAWKILGEDFETLGNKVTAADVTGDGLSDILLGSIKKVYAVLSPVESDVFLPDFPSIVLFDDNESIGDVSSLQDINGDGYHEAAYTNSREQAYIRLGPLTDTTLPNLPEVTLTGDSTPFPLSIDLYGITSAGDVNGDAYNDILLESMMINSSNTSLYTARGWLIYGPMSGTVEVYGQGAQFFDSSRELDNSNFFGDNNGDTVSDFVLSANTYTINQEIVGKIWIIQGLASDW